ncbi:Saf-pilin pilus formation protein SafA [Salmonella enterica subsp. enterica serovar Newport]|uniref:Saf-pilin pilus formation protein SafA n=1 Tax=Salmonella newport TaxID=108619 RepID=A0A3V2JQF3_SALNE|nr:Saf-pilin pilus formation protein SafA [Salmonella enterica]EAA7202991.1 Saf-pilin pilus formation protein SafA [Salmonella enterica subsp. enterica serovar Newport]EED8163540.1 Saf-pilin pilus formation protein SafA [Salmonella enterica subsp. enterica]EAB1534689.1 Saf-pilin pilus formation protein SafA [Salmonella enterica]EAB9681638.1 Saf-pilin pilus formation protein SafA [Salmonella enterica subsp. enterica serovar Newport]EAM1682910.1 Saf-pilin pilus formation protein SafA [Salmonella
MKNIKDLIIASALSIMAASCYAGSLVPNTSTGVSADVSFSNPGQLQAQLTPVAGLMAGQHGNGDVIAQLKVSGSIKQFAVTGDYSKPETAGNNSDVWKVKGKNGNTIAVSFQGTKWASKGSLVDGSAHKWWIYNMGDGIDVILSGAQTVNADIYPVTLNVAAYQA